MKVIGPPATGFQQRAGLGTRLGFDMEASRVSELSALKRARVTWSAEERVDWVRMFERSGKSLADFCRENDLPDATLSLWRRQLRGPEPATEESPLVEVTMPASSSPLKRPALRAKLPCGIELEVESGTDAQWLAGVLRALTPAGRAPADGVATTTCGRSRSSPQTSSPGRPSRR